MRTEINVRIAERLKERGYGSLRELFDAHPAVPFGVVLRSIAEPVPGTNYLDIPIMVLKQAYAQEAVANGEAREFSKDTLLRSLAEHLKRGWNQGKNAANFRSKAFANWHTPEGYDELCDAVWRELKLLNPPDDWRPNDLDDELLSEAFDRAWPY